MAESGLVDANGLYLRLVGIRFRPEGLEAAMERFRTVSSPLVRRQTGSVGIFGGGNRVTGSAYSISLWQSHEDLENSNADPDVVEAMAGYAEWMSGHFVVESFKVVDGYVPVRASVGVEGLWCRFVTANAVTTQQPRALELMAGRLRQVQEMSSRCVGTLLLSPLVGTKIVAIEYWVGPAGAAASEARVQAIDQRLSRLGVFQSPISRDLVEVFEMS